MKKLTSHLRGFVLVLLGLSFNTVMLTPARAQTWATNSPLQVARWAHTATLLNDGTVLVAGGTVYNMAGVFADTNAAEIYDPVANTTTLVGAMNYSRHSHRATLLQDGNVLVSGSGGSSEEYDPVGQDWVNFSEMNEERIVHTATLLPNGQVLAAGGYDDNQGIEVTNAEVYDPDSQTWTSTTPMPYAADTLAGVLLNNGKVLVCGGYDGNESVTNAVLYDPAAQTWTYTGPMNEARSGHAATLLKNGKVLVEGGAYDNSAEIYDPNTGVWTVAGSMNDGHTDVDAVLLTNGTVLVTGDGDSSTEIYDPSSDTWSYTSSTLPVAGNLQTETLLAGGQVVVTGGSVSQFNGPALAVVESYGAVTSGHTLTVTASPTNGLSPLAVQFTSPAVDSGGNTVTSWNWNFGDGASSMARSPQHTYTNTGVFSPSLTAYSTFSGAQLQIIGLGNITVTVPSLSVTANPPSGAAPLTVYFYSPGTDSLGYTVTNWNWTFGDGGVSTAQNPAHTYTNAGGYFPGLTARSTSGSTPLAVSGPSGISVNTPVNTNFRTLYTFNPTSGSNSTNIDGSGPSSGLLLSGSTLYGTAGRGGSKGDGVIFAFNTVSLAFSNVLNFGVTANSGIIPVGGMVLTNGTLFGVTELGGSNGGGGAVFAISTNGSRYTNVFSFTFSLPNSGEEPQAGVTLTGNTLYGGTQYGGTVAADAGVVYAVTTNGSTFSDRYAFSMPMGDYRMNGDGDGCFGRIICANGVLYGTTEAGGTAGDGVVFSVGTNSPGTFQVLHYFSAYNPTTGTNTDGAFPFSDLVLSSNVLYGTTYAGGFYGNGTIFAVNLNTMTFSNLYNFAGANDGSGPQGGLTLSGNTLYGTTSGGGTNSDGTLFSINTSGTNFTTLYAFTGGSDGSNPQADLVVSGNVIYGTAEGGSEGSGSVFAFTLPQATAPAIILTNLTRLPNGKFQFGFLNAHGSTNTVFGSTNVGTPFINWLSLGTATEISNGVFQFTDATTNLTKRFYRVVSP
jgi:uncharacterized repeat protein (TIGR03803 family)